MGNTSTIQYETDTHGNQIYPRKEVCHGEDQKSKTTVEYPLEKIGYAKKKKENAYSSYYPLGLHGDEYWFRDPKTQPKEYPTNNEGYYMIPLDEENKPVHFIESYIYEHVKDYETNPLAEKIEVYPGRYAIRTDVRTTEPSRTLSPKTKSKKIDCHTGKNTIFSFKFFGIIFLISFITTMFVFAFYNAYK